MSSFYCGIDLHARNCQLSCGTPRRRRREQPIYIFAEPRVGYRMPKGQEPGQGPE